ncbi:MAG: hypothetical protein JNN11_00100 [Candidatus Doudnabacteria bacterium]|nr:hypothetical protein [Candidatus Doudnabacteria bacterium]
MQKQNKGWFKPYILNPSNIEKLVTPKTPGVFVLGNMGFNKKIEVKHIKSSDDVRADLKKYLGKFQLFMYKPFRYQLEKIKEQRGLELRFA